MVKYDEVFRILTLTTPPSKIFEPKALRKYYLGFLKNLFEKYRYKVEYNCPVYLADNEKHLVDLVARKPSSTVGLEFSAEKFISLKSLEKLKALKPTRLVFIVKDGTIEDNHQLFFDHDLTYYENVYFKSLDFLDVLSYVDIISRVTAHKEKIESARAQEKKEFERLHGSEVSQLRERLKNWQFSQLVERAVLKDKDNSNQITKSFIQPDITGNNQKNERADIKGKENSNQISESSIQPNFSENNQKKGKTISRKRLVERLRKNRERIINE